MNHRRVWPTKIEQMYMGKGLTKNDKIMGK